MLALNLDWGIAFPGGGGTADMVRKLKAAGFEVEMAEQPESRSEK
jgi:hypothetical protein